MDYEPAQYSHRRASYPEVGTPETRRQIGKELKSAREFQEMSLEQVTAITKITVRFLENIEEGRWNFLPPTYVKAFIRAYSSAVGLQKDKLSNRLDELFSSVVTASAPVRPQINPNEDQSFSSKPISGFMLWTEKHRALIFYSVIGLIAASLITLYLIRSGGGQQAATSEDSTEVVRDVEPPTKPDTAKGAAALPVVTDSTAKDSIMVPIALRLSCRDTCFVRVESGESVVYEKTLWPGSVIDLSVPPPLRLSLGNAPAVEVSVDGRTLPAFPSSRRAQVINFGPGGVTN